MTKNFLLTLLATMLITLNISAQIVKVDNFGFALNNEDMTAELVNCQLTGGDIIVPETFDYEDNTYTVTSIGYYYDSQEKCYEETSPFCDVEYAAITLPRTIKKIAPNTFLSSEISVIRCLGSEAPVATDEIVYFYGNVTLYIPEGAKKNYQAAEYWNKFVDCREIADDATVSNTMEKATYENLSYTINHEYNTAVLIREYINDQPKGDLEIPSSFDYKGEKYTVKYIDFEVFYESTGITSLILPETIEEAPRTFLDGINLLGSLTLKGTKPIKLVNSNLEKSFIEDSQNSIMPFTDQTILYVPAGSKASYQSDPCWKSFVNIKEYNGDAQFQERLRCVEIDNITYALCDMNNTASLLPNGNDIYASYNAEKFIVPKTVTYEGNKYDVNFIAKNTFGYEGPSNVILPEGLKKISNLAFEDNETISEITLPSTLELIGYYAFKFCNNLKSIYCESKIPFTISNIAFDFKDDQTLFVPVGSKKLYEAAEGWKQFKNIEEMENLGIDDIRVQGTTESKTYDIQGRRVNDTYKGIMIKDGRKILH